MHFLFLVPPISARGPIPLYLWTCLKWIDSMRGQDSSIAFPATYVNALESRTGWEFESAGEAYNEYSIPDGGVLDGIEYHLYDETRLKVCEEAANFPMVLWDYMSSGSLGPDLFEPIIAAARERHGDVAVVTWLNCEPLKALCAKLGVPIIFNEIGPLRKPYYQHTAYFDFNGVNGGVSVGRDWAEQRETFIPWARALGINADSLRDLLAPGVEFDSSAVMADANDIGVALQVEDDSNAIAFSKGWSATALLSCADRSGRTFRVRMHPLGLALYRGLVDQSPSSLHFMLTCKEVWTVNSALGIEATFWGKAVKFFGESTIGFLKEVDPIDREWAQLYYFLCYLIPYQYLFDSRYYEWRLTKPSAVDIAAAHMRIYSEGSEAAAHTTKKVILAQDIPTSRVVLSNPVQDALYLARELDDVRAQLTTANGGLWKARAEYQDAGFALDEERTVHAVTRQALEQERNGRYAANREHVTRKVEYERQVVQYEKKLAELQKRLRSEERIARHIKAIYQSSGWRFLQRLKRALRWPKKTATVVRPGEMVPEPLPEDVVREILHESLVESTQVELLPDAEETAYSHLETMRIFSQTPEDMHDLFGGAALHRVLQIPGIKTALDVGSGGGEHARRMAAAGISVTCIDFGTSVYARERAAQTAQIDVIHKDYIDHAFEEQFDLVWASHVLEHQPNVRLFIEKLKKDCKPGGVIAITVPPLKHSIVGGHLSLWNAGLLLYNLAAAGIDCSKAIVLNYGYNISVIVHNKHFSVPPLDYDAGDIDRLSPWLPSGCKERFDGRMFAKAPSTAQ
jgi:SAM-dependent methyltransferase